MQDLDEGIAKTVKGDLNGEEVTLDALLQDPTSRRSKPSAAPSTRKRGRHADVESSTSRKRSHVVFTDAIEDCMLLFESCTGGV